MRAWSKEARPKGKEMGLSLLVDNGTLATFGGGDSTRGW